MIRKDKIRAFTVVEILVVIAVLAILMGLVASGGTQARKRALIYQTKTMIASLETALALYHVDFGAYPAAGNQNMVNYLAYPDPGYSADWQGPYMSFKDNDLSGSMPNATLLDPWGSAYHYVLGTVPAYRIWSNGPDHADDSGGDDDIKSW